MPTKKQIKLPFDLPDRIYQTIEIAPEIVGVMLSGSPQEIESIESIAQYWENNKDSVPVFGVRIVRKFGFSAPELKRLRDDSAARRSAAIASMELIKKISIETGKHVNDIQRDIAIQQAIAEGNKVEAVEGEEEGTEIDYLIPYMGQFLEIDEQLKNAISETMPLTILMQRAIHNWRDELTASLHPNIIESLNALLDLEYEGLPAQKK